MPIVDKNIIREWFKNLKKPTEDHFWAWLDSFYHKWEGIAIEGITGLVDALSKKADLVGGVVPPHQLPFTIDANEVISIGEITVTTDTVNIAVHESGSNVVRINGQILTRSFQNNFPFTPISTGSKFLRVVAKNATGLFFLKEGIESDEPQEPSLDAGELHVRLILVTPEGNVIDPELLTGYKEKAEDNWKKTYVFSSAILTLEKSDVRTRFLITRTFLSGIDPVDPIYNIQGIRFTDKSREIEFLIKNDTPENVFLQQNDTVDDLIGFSENYTLKPGTWIFSKYNKTTDKLDILKVGTSESMTVVVTDNTLKGSGNVGNPLGLSDLKNAEIAGKVDKTTTPTQSIASALAIGQMTADEKLHVNGRTKTNSVVLSNEIGTAVPNELGRKNGFLCHSDASGVLRYYSASGLFKFTPTGNFTTSQLKTALDASKITYHDAYVCIVVGSNNYTCNIDNGSSNVSSLLFIGKEGTTGSINFTSSRTINSGSENITIMNGNEGSMTKISHGTSADILTVRNL